MTYLSKDISKWKLPDIEFNRLTARKSGPFFRFGAKFAIICSRLRRLWQQISQKNLLIIGNFDQLLYIKHDNSPASGLHNTFFLEL